MKLEKWFKVNGEERQFMRLYGTEIKAEVDELKQWVKAQGDIYRITQHKGYYVIWDARS